MAHGTIEAELARDLEGTAYRFVRTLSGGAMGEVVLVEHVGLGELRVMKLLRAHLADVEGLATRLRTEARVLTRLTHENLVKVLDFGRTQSGRSFLVMEYLRGRTLKEVVAVAGPLSVEAAADLVGQILRGLAVVHGAGIVHRDLKPDNVFVCDEPVGPHGAGPVTILDFGIAKILTLENRTQLGHVAATEEGMLVGTPAYLSPEQALGKPLDGRADLYAVGAILYFLVTGKAPFQGDSLVELLRAHVVDPPRPPSAERPAAAPLDAAVLRALTKRPEDRFSDAGAFLAALEAVLDRMKTERRSAAEAPRGPVEATVLIEKVRATPPRRPAQGPERQGPEKPTGKRAPGRPWVLVAVLAVLLGALVAVLVRLVGP
jgi:serine/threonine-protein kinase